MIRTLTALFILLLCSIKLIAQQKQPTKDPQNMQVKTSQEAHYPKGDQALFTYIHTNIKYPESSKGIRVEGEVMLSFFVNPDSILSNIKVISGVGHGIDEEVVALLKPLKFAPCIQNGTKIKANMMLNIPVFKRAEE